MNGEGGSAAPKEGGVAPESCSEIVLGGFDEHGTFQPTVHLGRSLVRTGAMIDLYVISRMIVQICRRRIGDQERVRLSQLATWLETMLLGALAGANPEYDGHWFDVDAGVWRNARNSSDGRNDR